MSERQKVNEHWLARPATVKYVWLIFAVVLALTVVVQLLVPVKGTFALEGSFGFGAWFGFLSCVAMVLAAKVLGWVLKRSEDYYGEADPLPEDDRA